MMNLQCGVAERIVTPALGLDIPGYFTPRPATGVKDELMVEALVADDGEHVVALISVDIIDFKPVWAKQTRQRIKEAIGLDPSCVMMAATHIHTGSPRGYAAFEGFNVKGGEHIIDAAAEAVIEAYRTRRPVKIGYGVGEERRIAFCRNYWMKDGSIRTNPGRKYAEDVVEPVGHIDHSVTVMRLEDLSGKPVAFAVNFACHPDTVGGTEYSADYPGEVRRLIKEKYGKDTVVLFFNGCSGNVNHVDAMRYKTDPTYRHPADHYKWMGACLFETVEKINEGLVADVTAARVAARSRLIRGTRRQPTADDLAWADERLADPDCSVSDRTYAIQLHQLHDEPKRYSVVEVQAFAIGDCAFVGFQGEAFADMGLDVKADSRFAYHFTVELANGSHGYLVTEPCASGGPHVYEARLARDNSYFPPQTVNKITNTAKNILQIL